MALITRENRILNSAVQLGNFPTRKLASPDMWESFVERFRRGQQPLPQAWADLFGPLCAGTVDDLVSFIAARVLDHLGVDHSVAPRWGGEPSA